ncbi:MAG: hypothetical protein WAU77_14405 [Solirubrobacteraceae bacterium]
MAEDYGTVCGLTPGGNQGLFVKRTVGVCEEELAEDTNEFEQVLLSLTEWLVAGSEITAELNVEAAGELLMEDTKTALGASDILCSGLLDGTIGPDGLGVISEVLTLAKMAVSTTALSGTALTCEEHNVCSEPLLWAVNLPWNTLLELAETDLGTIFVDLILAGGKGNPGWYVECMGLAGLTDECRVEGASETGEGVFEAVNVTGGVEAIFSEAITELLALKLAECAQGGKETGVVEGSGNIIKLASGTEALTVSTETEDYGTVCGLTPNKEGLFVKRSATGVCEEELAEDTNEFEQVLLLLTEWLVAGSEITAELNVEAAGELLMEDTKTLLGASDILCSGLLDGTIGPDGLGVVSEVLTLAKMAVSSTVLSGTALTCEEHSVCAEPLLWAVNLPWNTLLELAETDLGTIFVDLILAGGKGNPGYYLECMGLSGLTDECKAEGASETGEGVFEAVNVTGGVEATFSEAITELLALKLGECTRGGKETGVVEGSGNIIKLASGTEALTVSSET